MLIKDCSYVITQNPKREIIKDTDVLIEGDRIVEIGKNLERGGRIIDGKSKALLPGFINTHTHLAMTLFRGYADDMQLQAWLQDRIWPVEAKLNRDYCYSGTLLGMLEFIKSGTTTFHDMYFFGDAVKEASQNSGIRTVFSQGVLDFPTCEFKNPEEAFGLFKKLVKHKSELFTPNIGTHAPYTCSRETLLRAKDLAKEHDSRIHTHVSETRKEVNDSLKQHKKRPVEYLNDIGFLGSEILVAHAGWVTKGEVRMFGETGTKVSHCPISNMKLAVGAVIPIPEMFEYDVVVSLGTDSAASNNNMDMLEEMKVAALLQKAHRWDPTLLPAQRALDMATIDGAKALGMEGEIGSIEVGKKADLILLDLAKSHMVPNHNVVSNIVYSASGQDVETTIVNGEVLMEEGIVKTLDEKEVLYESQKKAKELVGE